MNLYVVKDEAIIRTDTGNKLETMNEIAKHLNWICSHNSYTAMKDKDGNEYVYFSDYAHYYNLEELCELCNGLWKERTTKCLSYGAIKFKKHMENKKKCERQPPVPYTWDGRFNYEHTTRKGFWLEDWVSGKEYYLHIKEHIDAIVGLLNDYTTENRFCWGHSKVGNVIKDTVDDEIYVLGDSRDVGLIRDILNYYDMEKYGKRKLPYRHMLM